MAKPTESQLAQIERLVEEGQKQDPQGSISEKPIVLIPQEYTESGKGAREIEETEGKPAQVWPPRRPTRGGVEEFVEGPLIPGKVPPKKRGCNGDCTQSAVKTTADPVTATPVQPTEETPVEPVKPSGRTKCQSLAYHILVEWQPMLSPYASWVTREMKICNSNKEEFKILYPWTQEFKAAGCTYKEAVGHVYPKGDYNEGKEAEHLKRAFDDADFWISRCQAGGDDRTDPGAGPGATGSGIPQ